MTMDPRTLERPRVVVLEPDLFFAPRMVDVIQALGGQAIVVETPAALVDAVARWFPHLVLVDLSTPGDWEGAIRRCKLLPHTRQAPIVAFGSHVDTATLDRAREAGADHVWPRSRFMADLPDLVRRHLEPAPGPVPGCQDPPSRPAVAGLLAFNQGRYFEQHEYLELAWNQEPGPVRELYQGILQVGVAFHHMLQGNWRGAIKMFRRGLPKLRRFPDVCQGIQVGRLREAAEAIHRELTVGGPPALARWTPEQLPRVEFENPYGVDEPEALVELPE